MNTTDEVLKFFYDYSDNITDSEDYLIIGNVTNDTLNSTLPELQDNHRDIHELFMEYYFHIITVLLFFGCPLNIFHFFVLFQKELRLNVVYRLMMGVAIYDFCTHICTFLSFSPFWIRTTPTEEEECFTTQKYFDVMMDWIVVPILDTTQRASSWMAVFMALYRTLSVMFPLSSRIQKLSAMHIVLIASATALFFSASTGMPVFLSINVYINTTEETCTGEIVELNEPRYSRRVRPELRPFYFVAVTFYGLFKLLPAIIDLILAILLVLELLKAKRRRKNLNQKEDDHFDSTTKLIAFMTFSFFILEVPNGVGHVVFGLFVPTGTALKILQVALDVAEIFPVINCASHVFVCFLLTAQYRDTVKTLLRIPIKNHKTFTVVAKSSAASNS